MLATFDAAVTGHRSHFDALYAAAKADPKGWLAANRADVQKGLKRPLVRFVARNHPELFEGMDSTVSSDGDMFMAKLAGGHSGVSAAVGLDKAKVVAFLEKIIPILKFIAPLTGPYAPAVLAVVVVLQLIVDRYHANNPTVGLGLEDL